MVAWILSLCLLLKIVKEVGANIGKSVAIVVPPAEENQFSEMASEAALFRGHLQRKIWEMRCDPTTTEEDWEYILGVCRYSDLWFETTHPKLGGKYKTEDLVSIARGSE